MYKSFLSDWFKELGDEVKEADEDPWQRFYYQNCPPFQPLLSPTSQQCINFVKSRIHTSLKPICELVLYLAGLDVNFYPNPSDHIQSAFNRLSLDKISVKGDDLSWIYSSDQMLDTTLGAIDVALLAHALRLVDNKPLATGLMNLLPEFYYVSVSEYFTQVIRRHPLLCILEDRLISLYAQKIWSAFNARLRPPYCSSRLIEVIKDEIPGIINVNISNLQSSISKTLDGLCQYHTVSANTCSDKDEREECEGILVYSLWDTRKAQSIQQTIERLERKGSGADDFSGKNESKITSHTNKSYKRATSKINSSIF